MIVLLARLAEVEIRTDQALVDWPNYRKDKASIAL